MHALFSHCCRAAGFAVLALALAALMPAVATADPASCAGADSRPGQAPASELASATVCLINAERAARGLTPVRESDVLETGASRYAGEMVAQRFFSHTDRSGGNVATRMDVIPAASAFEEFGENLGWGSFDMTTPRSMVQGWMESPTHRENVLYPRFDELGIGIALGAPVEGRTDAATYAAVFGDRSPERARTARASARPRACRGKRAKTARGKRACKRALAAQRARARAARARS